MLIPADPIFLKKKNNNRKTKQTNKQEKEKEAANRHSCDEVLPSKPKNFQLLLKNQGEKYWGHLKQDLHFLWKKWHNKMAISKRELKFHDF